MTRIVIRRGRLNITPEQKGPALLTYRYLCFGPKFLGGCVGPAPSYEVRAVNAYEADRMVIQDAHWLVGSYPETSDPYIRKAKCPACQAEGYRLSRLSRSRP